MWTFLDRLNQQTAYGNLLRKLSVLFIYRTVQEPLDSAWEEKMFGRRWMYCAPRLNVVWRVINWETGSTSVMQCNAKYIANNTDISGREFNRSSYWHFNTKQVSGADIYSPNLNELYVWLSQSVVLCCQWSNATNSIYWLHLNVVWWYQWGLVQWYV